MLQRHIVKAWTVLEPLQILNQWRDEASVCRTNEPHHLSPVLTFFSPAVCLLHTLVVSWQQTWSQYENMHVVCWQSETAYLKDLIQQGDVEGMKFCRRTRQKQLLICSMFPSEEGNAGRFKYVQKNNTSYIKCVTIHTLQCTERTVSPEVHVMQIPPGYNFSTQIMWFESSRNRNRTAALK